MGRNNADLNTGATEGSGKSRGYDPNDENARQAAKARWRVGLQQEHGRAVESLDRAEDALRRAGEL